jgi:hypothetical protein
MRQGSWGRGLMNLYLYKRGLREVIFRPHHGKVPQEGTVQEEASPQQTPSLCLDLGLPRTVSNKFLLLINYDNLV